MGTCDTCGTTGVIIPHNRTPGVLIASGSCSKQAAPGTMSQPTGPYLKPASKSERKETTREVAHLLSDKADIEYAAKYCKRYSCWGQALVDGKCVNPHCVDFS